ncbi:MAG: CDP-diacylglycerol--glycerol-3-phosphate 3-phosphatidyltransferase [Pirellulaceae bacterium]|nr:CDP-diacylglycerol--glycerol-3-phosphate 3-phosphatidyltransferase [Pirellulaceae bacterium]
MANSTDATGDPNRIWNVPNLLSMARLLLSLFVGLLIEWQYYLVAAILFLIAATTDFVDGWWARRYGQVTKLGRILDPFVDKIIVTAALVALVGQIGSGVAAWMVTVIVGRELLVTSLRAMVEGRGGDFSAVWMGKWKMGLQCAAIVASLLKLAYGSQFAWLGSISSVLLWSALLLTVASGIDYVARAISLSRSP